MDWIAALVGLAVAAVALATALAKIIAVLVGRVATIGEGLTSALNGLNSTLAVHHQAETDWAQRLSGDIREARDHVVREVSHDTRAALASALLKRDVS